MPDLSFEERDVLTEFINIGLGRAAGMLNQMVQAQVRLTVPNVRVLTLEQLQQESQQFGDDPLSAVLLGFRGAFVGTAALVFPTDSAANLVSVLTGEDPSSPDLDAVKVGTLNEVGNIMLNGVMGSLSNLLKRRVAYALPVYAENSITALLAPKLPTADATIILAQTRFYIKTMQIDGTVILIFEVESFNDLQQAIQQVLQEQLEL
ncbi:MAG: chemotaxis protein CheC [Chloroflexi bacterium]|nr:MAG: chemotaxis protein CheC [Chloroflexota bacterium]